MKSISLSNEAFSFRSEFGYTLNRIQHTINFLRKEPSSLEQIRKLKVILSATDVLIRGLGKLIHIDEQHEAAKEETKVLSDTFKEFVPSILLVDDLQIIGCDCTRYLIEMGFSVEYAENRAQVLPMLVKKNYELVILNIQIDKREVIEICKDIRLNKKNIRIPIIVITSGEAEIISSCLNAGANEIALTPITFGKLKKLIKKHINLP